MPSTRHDAQATATDRIHLVEYGEDNQHFRGRWRAISKSVWASIGSHHHLDRGDHACDLENASIETLDC